MRVLHVLDHSIPLHSGYTFRTVALLREQRALGWETFHLTSPKQGQTSAPIEDIDGLRFYRTQPATGPLAGLPVGRELSLMKHLEARLEEVARDIKPDIIHAHSPVLNALPAIKVARRLGIPVVYEIRAFWEDAAVDHGSTSEGSLRYSATRRLETRAIRLVDHVFTICEGLRADIVTRGIPAEKVTVIPNAVNVESFQLASPPDPQLQAQWGLTGKTVVGFIGSFYAYEGLDLLLDALPELIRQRPDVCVLLVGGGPQEANLRQQTERLGVSNHVIFTGRVPHEDVNRYYNLINVLAYPRHRMRLTELVTPLKPLEAMAQGQLFVASDVGGHKELIDHNKTGILYKAGDCAALTEALLTLLNDQQRWPELKAHGRHFVESKRNWRNSVANYVAPYQRLIRPKT
ncbi:TIGR04063 family PEP-CTERM/XrtA system glycosyltransferase [Ferribacterium limneticum]|uniref:TIGR04063 family PEP-CTERM/XrtA system glycosyltransferase n=1 Tax=Ferribacterium limneticum TaxID=76259 RepID=UPI001CF9F46A|nr:TIGR04063 family PEP-CTERM/XrtA system glycosyltransferase [Ferribacterium limneticum]UCV20955.1 glycosyltransferase, exosortase A system-associated [Ferribacterium limneticum]